MNFKFLKNNVLYVSFLILVISLNTFASPLFFQLRGIKSLSKKSEIENQVLDPCKDQMFSDDTGPVIRPVFEKGSKFEEFQKYYSSGHQSLAFKKWIISTPTFRMASSEEDVEIFKLKTKGIWNEGIYEVTFHRYPNQRYILKETAVIGEASRLLKLQNSRVGHPECWARSDIGLQRVATQEEVQIFPRIPLIREVAAFVSPTRKVYSKVKKSWRISDDYRYLILMEKAKGKSLFDLSDEVYREQLKFSEFLKIFKSIGKSLGYFHYFFAKNAQENFQDWRTWVHGDLNWNNIFFDSKTNQVTFLDNETMRAYRDEGDYYFDFFQLFYFLIFNALDTSNSRPGLLTDYISRLQFSVAERVYQKMENQKEDPDIDFSSILDPCEAVLIAFKDQDILSDNSNVAILNQMKRNFSIFKSGVEGYLEVFRNENQKKEVCEYFRQKCRKKTLQFMSNYSRIFKSNLSCEPAQFAQSFHQLEPELVAALRNLFPPCFLDFLDEGRF